MFLGRGLSVLWQLLWELLSGILELLWELLSGLLWEVRCEFLWELISEMIIYIPIFGIEGFM